MSDVLRLENVKKTYGEGDTANEVLHGITLRLKKGEFAALIGPSGSGKSTLLNMIGLLEPPTSGEIYLQETATSKLSEQALTVLRGKSIGFVFQFHHLIPAFDAVENVMMPLLIDRKYPDAAMREKAMELLTQVGLAEFAHRKPNQLSGGQQQRVAIVRALAMDAPLILADEPTGNLDTKTADDIFALLRKLNVEKGLSFLIVTHDSRLAERCDRIIRLVDGNIVEDAIVHA